MSHSARASGCAPPGHGEIRDLPLAAPGDGEVLVRAMWSGISRGTETLVFHGQVPRSQ
jgi:NADPH:quinone reductase-like Zn-dependent oxidoreductase